LNNLKKNINIVIVQLNIGHEDQGQEAGETDIETRDDRLLDHAVEAEVVQGDVHKNKDLPPGGEETVDPEAHTDLIIIIRAEKGLLHE
jgi:hypothetical protein